MPKKNFSFTGAEQTWSIPSDSDKVSIECWAGAGGKGYTDSGHDSRDVSNGDLGGYATGNLNVTGGETLYVYVGGRGGDGADGSGGSGGWPTGGSGGENSGVVSGGGGGGSSDIRQGGNTLTDRVIVAGAGGGGGAAAETSGGGTDSGPGGYGGGTAQNGNNASYGDASASGGTGGGQSGASGGNSGGTYGGALENYSNYAAGGGGGGHNGGGAGGYDASGDDAAGAGGGGGDGGLIAVSSGSMSTAAQSGDGAISIIYVVAPTSPAASTASSTSIDLSWTDQNSGAAGYEIYRSTSSGVTTADTLVTTTAAGATSYTDTGLSTGTTYYYAIRGVQSGATSVLSTEVSSTTPLAEPTLDSIDVTVEDQNTVYWTKNDSSTGGEFEVHRSTDGSTFSIVGDAISPSTTSYTDTGVSDGEKYWYKVVRVSSGGETSESGAKADVSYFPSPTGVSIANITSTGSDVSWTDNADNEDNYRVYTERADNPTGMDFIQSNSQRIEHDKAEYGTEATVTVEFNADVLGNGGTNNAGLFEVDDGGFNRMIGIRLNSDGTFSVYVRGTGTNVQFTTSASVATGATHRVTLTYDSTGVTFYLDGTEVGSSTSDVGEVTDIPNGSIGRTNDPRYYDGQIYDVGVWGRVLSGSEISTLNSGGMVYNGLTAYWPLDLNQSGTTPDLSVLSHDGTLNGSTGTPTIVGSGLTDQSGALASGTTAYTIGGLLNGEKYNTYVHAETEDSTVRDQ